MLNNFIYYITVSSTCRALTTSLPVAQRSEHLNSVWKVIGLRWLPTVSTWLSPCRLMELKNHSVSLNGNNGFLWYHLKNYLLLTKISLLT